MKILVTYDVDTTGCGGAKRLRDVAKACVNHGQRVQNSVFECILTEVQYVILKRTLSSIIDHATDSIRFYHLSANRQCERLGKETSYDPQAPLII